VFVIKLVIGLHGATIFPLHFRSLAYNTNFKRRVRTLLGYQGVNT